MGFIGGVAIGVNPQDTYQIVSTIVCPEDSELTYYDIKRSYHSPGESEPHVECVYDDGRREDVTLPATLIFLGLVFGISVVLIFLTLFIPLSVLAVKVKRRSDRGKRKEDQYSVKPKTYR